MAYNEKTPAGANGEGFQNVAVGTADGIQIAPRPLEIQTFRLRHRFGLSAAVAAVVAAHAYAVPEIWGGRA